MFNIFSAIVISPIYVLPLTYMLVSPPHIRICGVPSHSFGDISSASFLYASSMHGRLLSAASRLCHSICIFDAWAQPHDVMPPRIHSAAGCQHHFNMHLRCMGASSYIKYSVHAVGLDIFSSRCNLRSHKCLGELVCFNNAVYGYLL